MKKHEEYMKLAILEAKKALLEDEVPVGAIIVYNNQVIAGSHNTNDKSKLATRHAEINAIEEACHFLNSKYLDKCSIYITLEPCLMCLGAILNARIKDVYFGAYDLKGGRVVSDKITNNINWTSGILKEECKELLTNYFISKRLEE